MHSLLDAVEKDSMDKDDLVEERQNLRRDLRVANKDLAMTRQICAEQQQTIGELQCKLYSTLRLKGHLEEMLRLIAIAYDEQRLSGTKGTVKSTVYCSNGASLRE